MFTYLTEIINKETQSIIDSKEFTENIYFHQILSGDTYVDIQPN